MASITIKTDYSTTPVDSFVDFWSDVLTESATAQITATIVLEATGQQINVTIEAATRYVSGITVGTTNVNIGTNAPHNISDSLPISASDIYQALCNLANNPSNINNTNTRSLLIIFVSEAARFEILRRVVIALFRDDEPPALSGAIVNPIVRVWGHLRSANGLVYIANTDTYFRYNRALAAPAHAPVNAFTPIPVGDLAIDLYSSIAEYGD